MANNQCAAKEEAPAPGSNAPHARTDYDCQGPPVSWILFVSFCLPSLGEGSFIMDSADFYRMVGILLHLMMVAKATAVPKLSPPQRPGSSSVSSLLVAKQARAKEG
jgi:hypothetical protein